MSNMNAVRQVQHVRDALLARAAELRIAGPSEEATIDALLDREVRVAPPNEAECRAYYRAHCDQHQDAFRPGSIVELDHILFAVTDPVPHRALRTQAEAVLQQLVAGEVDFAETARQVSNCPSANVGGNLGQLTQADVVPEFWRTVMAHGQPGLVPQLVESRFGLHIVRIHRVAPGQVLPFERARAQIEEFLAEQRLRTALQEYVHGLVHPGHADEHAHEHQHLREHEHEEEHVHEQEHQHRHQPQPQHDHAHVHELRRPRTH